MNWKLTLGATLLAAVVSAAIYLFWPVDEDDEDETVVLSGEEVLVPTSEDDVPDLLHALTDDPEFVLSYRRARNKTLTAKALREARHEMGYDQEEAAERLGVTVEHLKSLESRDYPHNFGSVKSHLDKLKASYDWQASEDGGCEMIVGNIHLVFAPL